MNNQHSAKESRDIGTTIAAARYILERQRAKTYGEIEIDDTCLVRQSLNLLIAVESAGFTPAEAVVKLAEASR